MTDKMNTDGFFAAELSLDDLENVAGGMKPEYEQSLRNDIRNARNSGYSKDEFIKEILGLYDFSESDLSEWGTTKKEMLKIIDDAFII